MAKLYFRYGVMGSSKTANALMVRYNYEAGPGRPAGQARGGSAGRGPVRGLPGEAEPPVHLLLRPDGDDAPPAQAPTPASSWTRPSSSPGTRCATSPIWWTTGTSPSSATACAPTSRGAVPRLGGAAGHGRHD